jgi:hypothetical protein
MERPVSHLSDDDLVLHYYGENGAEALPAERHLHSCARCAQTYEALTQTLRIVTPDIVDVPGDAVAFEELLRAWVRGSSPTPAATLPWWQRDPAAVACAWLVPMLYPLSLPAVFASAQWAREQPAGIVLTTLSVLWACAGPLAAMLALHRLAGGLDRVSARLRVLGAIMATIAPPLFLLVAGGQHARSWYAVMAGAAVLALVPWRPFASPRTLRLRPVHRLSAVVLGIFVLGHVIDQSLAFASVPSYAAMRGVMRLASQQSISYAVIVAAVAVQILSGTAMALKHVRAGACARNLQAVSGWYLAVFLLAHVFAGFVMSRPASVSPAATSLTPPYLLASVTVVAQLPYYLLGVAAFLVHVGLYARVAALACLAQASVRRLSYAGACVGAMVVATVGLSLCGIHLLH